MKARQHPPAPFDLIAGGLLLAFGFVLLTSASLEVSWRATGDALYYVKKQLLFAGIGLSVMLILSQIPLQVWRRLAPVLGVVAVAMLVLVLIPGIGIEVNEGRRWLSVAGIQFQPSELAKPLLLMWLAVHLTQHREDLRSHSEDFLVPLIAICGVIMLLLLEPDFGTSVLFLMVGLGMMFLCGKGRPKQYLGVGLMAVVCIGVLVQIAPYRMQRFLAFIDPWSDPYGIGYQLVQSLIAVGSGGLFGKGLGDGVQKLSYLPEVHTDFVFAVAAEEFGLFGTVFIILLFGVFFLGALRVARYARLERHLLAAAVASGVALWIGMQAFVNIAVNIGALPTKGLTLPLISAGGSSLVATLAGFGLLWRAHLELGSPPPRGRKGACARR